MSAIWLYFVSGDGKDGLLMTGHFLPIRHGFLGMNGVTMELHSTGRLCQDTGCIPGEKRGELS
jgi:hypothetical protein